MPVPATNCTGEPSYVMFSKGTTSGGFCKVSPENILSPALHPDNPEKARLSVRVTLKVDSVDETFVAVKKAGGAVYMYVSYSEKYISKLDADTFVARRARFRTTWATSAYTDTEKNVMGVWSAT